MNGKEQKEGMGGMEGCQSRRWVADKGNSDTQGPYRNQVRDPYPDISTAQLREAEN